MGKTAKFDSSRSIYVALNWTEHFLKVSMPVIFIPSCKRNYNYSRLCKPEYAFPNETKNFIHLSAPLCYPLMCKECLNV